VRHLRPTRCWWAAIAKPVVGDYSKKFTNLMWAGHFFWNDKLIEVGA
jgi:hypothetical protein